MTLAETSMGAEVQIAMDVRQAKLSGGEGTTGTIVVRRNGNTQELVFRLENSNPGLMRLSVTEIRLKPAETSASFDILTASTPIKTAVTIKAFLQPADQVQVQKAIEIIPATLKGVTLSQPTLNGTHGSKITCRAQLNANAPAGGIELYAILVYPGLTLNIPNPRVEAGTKEVTFEIAYDKLYLEGDSIGSTGRTIGISQFNSQTRKLDLFVSLDPQVKQAVSGVAGKVSFDVIPLRVASFSVQPNSVTGGAEAMATFTLNFPAGHSERVRLRPENGSSSGGKAWARPLGSSCQVIPPQVIEMQLAEGATTHSFKVCTGPSTAAKTESLTITTRNEDDSTAQVTVQP